MHIHSISFSKTPDNGNGWKINNCILNKINLITGKNSSGKTRLLKGIYSLVKLLSDGEDLDFKMNITYSWVICLKNDTGKEIEYQLKYKNKNILEEKLLIDGIVYFNRDNSGIGKITYESLDNKQLDFEVEENRLVIKTKRDKKQHPALEDIFNWVKSIYMYKFGTTLGRNTIISKMDINEALMAKDDEAVVLKYEYGLKHVGDTFKSEIIKDFNSIGYSIVDIGTTTENELKELLADSNIPIPSLLYIKEEGITDRIFQNEISQGMFRVLSLIIQIKYLEKNNLSTSILIDDIGEGLDYERSTKLINYIIEKAKSLEKNIQLIMTTNDRFVMNSIELKYWTVIDRDKDVINFYNQKTHKKLFNDFKKIGLNNFDFFESEYFKSKDVRSD